MYEWTSPTAVPLIIVDYRWGHAQRLWRLKYGARVLQELREEGLVDPRNAEHLERALQLVCLVVTHGWRGGNVDHQLQVRQLVPSTGSPDGF
jgi:hypothetical protein